MTESARSARHARDGSAYGRGVVSASTPSSTAGQASVELLAVTPFLVALVLTVAQLSVAGYALWSAADAARAGARASLVGGNPALAAHSALPAWLGDEAEVDISGPVKVALEAPAVLPFLPDIPISAAAELGPVRAGVDG